MLLRLKNCRFNNIIIIINIYAMSASTPDHCVTASKWTASQSKFPPEPTAMLK